MNEAQLINGCKKRDKKSQRMTFDRYSRGMMAVCCRYIRDRHHAEEILLSGFLKFFNSIDRFVYQDEDSIGKWLKTIMLNECFMFLRKTGSVKFVAEDFYMDVVSDVTVIDKMNSDEIKKAVDAMPEGYRFVFNLFVMEGYSHKEIGELLQISEGASKSQLSRAKIFLQKQLSKAELYNGR